MRVREGYLLSVRDEDGKAGTWRVVAIGRNPDGSMACVLEAEGAGFRGLATLPPSEDELAALLSVTGGELVSAEAVASLSPTGAIDELDLGYEFTQPDGTVLVLTAWDSHAMHTEYVLESAEGDPVFVRVHPDDEEKLGQAKAVAAALGGATLTGTVADPSLMP